MVGATSPAFMDLRLENNAQHLSWDGLARVSQDVKCKSGRSDSIFLKRISPQCQDSGIHET